MPGPDHVDVFLNRRPDDRGADEEQCAELERANKRVSYSVQPVLDVQHDKPPTSSR
jgi:Flp pilus assembly protein CpaB